MAQDEYLFHGKRVSRLCKMPCRSYVEDRVRVAIGKLEAVLSNKALALCAEMQASNQQGHSFLG